MQSGHDVLLGWLDTSLAALDEAGRRASKETPVSFDCDLARGESDFECVRLNEKEVGLALPGVRLVTWNHTCCHHLLGLTAKSREKCQP